MQIEKLQLKNLRGIYQTEIDFSPGLNLIVGINGVGKTTVLEALRILISQVMTDLTSAPRYNLGFEEDDIMHNRHALTADLSFNCHNVPFSYTVHKSRENWVDSQSSELREQVINTPKQQQLTPKPNKAEFLKKTPQPICVFFSTRRSYATDEKSKTADSQKSAYFGALLNDRGLRIRDLVEWWKSKESIAQEAPEGKSAKQLNIVRKVLSELLPNFKEWKRDGDDITVNKQVTFQVLGEDRVETFPLSVFQLSEGERALISFTFDLTRRLAQANPDLEDPVSEGSGVVLIDEIDLHLHPEWQRVITHDLTRIFPKLQFITTTHSPQIIGETLPENVILLTSGGTIIPVIESLGRESGWILRHLMHTSERTVPMEEGLSEVTKLIAAGDLPTARTKVAELRQKYGPDPALISADTTLDRRFLFKK